jgi:two-component system phosphate regulon sensor histidine kinase PhoR
VTRILRRPSQLFWKLFAGYAVLMTLALGVCVLLIEREIEQFHAQELTEHLLAQARTLRSQVRGRLDSAHREQLDRIAKEVGGSEADGTRVTIVAADGTVLGDSQADVSRMDSHADREEIREALDEGWGESTRWSNTLRRALRYVAIRVGTPQNPEGVVRVAVRVKTIGARTQSMRRIIWTIAIVALAATIVFALGLARLWTMPIRRITRIAGRLSRGDLSARARVRGSDELARLAQSLNEMGDHLSEQLGTIDGQRRTLEALLDQLQEGVIVAGPDGRIVLSNPAAARLLHPDNAEPWVADSWAGRPIEQCVPQHDLQRLLLGSGPTRTSWEGASARSSPFDASTPRVRSVSEVRLEVPSAGGPVVLLARASDIEMPAPLTDSERPDAARAAPRTGRILALTDITDIARTIQMKTDFVANASHELRTPLSAIRAAIETVMNIDIGGDAESAGRFLRVIDRHSARLEALVTDLLALSRLESIPKQTKPAVIDLGRFRQGLSERWADSVSTKQLHWECDIPPALREMTANADLLKMALDNLIDNAIKFTAAGGRVCLAFRREQDNLKIEVTDNGCGIPAQDQERVFERFYQVAPARSGADGGPAEQRGTGLGLAIVRHAVASMGGTVSLTSELGKGTRVTLTIPQPTRP